MSQRTCERCGALLPEEARFCPRCGAWVAEEDAGEERKLVTVLFADIAASTRLASSLDPERFREVMGAFYKLASDELSSLRGRAEKFVGDAVMAVFGLPLAHDDDALRAVRAGLTIRDGVERLGKRLGLERPLRVRVGINTGAVVASTAPSNEFMVSGAAVNMAARLQQAADPGEVLVGDTTWQLTRHQAEFGTSRPVEARGFAEEIHACPVVSLTPRSSRRTIPLVGRRRELSLAAGAVERAAETSRAHLVSIVGEAGIGKTRLVQELLAGLPEETEVLTGRASEFGEDVTFAPLADMVRRRLSVPTEASTDDVRRRLDEVVTGCCDSTDTERVTAQLGLLLGLGEERQSNPYRGAEIRAGLLSLVEGLSRTAPVVIVLDDLQLARPALLDLIEEMVRGARRLPLTVVAVAREDLLRHRPGWGSGLADALVLRLESLRLDESRELAAAAGGQAVDQEAAERLAREAGGNPFFIVETTGMLVHESDAHTHGPAPRAVGAFPPTVQAVVSSRIDHLPEPARNLIRIASIFPGGAFHESKLALVTEASPEVLSTLEDEELLVRDEDRSGRWRFRHELLREVAYDSLPKRERRRLHEQVAEGLDELESTEAHAQEVAFHLEQAALAAQDLDPADGEPRQRAEAALRRAGDLARRRVESRAAVDLYERGLAMAGPEEAWGPAEARILAGIGEARYWLGEYDDAEATLALALEKSDGDPWTRALAGRFLADIMLNIHADMDQAEKMFGEALEAADELGDPWTRARTLLMAGWVGYWRRDLDAARRTFEQALGIARDNPEQDRWGEARALISLAGVSSAEGLPGEVLELADQALEVGRTIGDPFTVATAQERRSNSFRALWRLEEALACSQEAIRIYRDLGARWELASALGDRGTVYRLLGRLEEAEADLREAWALCTDLGDRVLVSWTASELAMILTLRGRFDEAGDILEDPSVPEDEEGPGDRSAVLWARSLLAQATGEPGAARDAAVEALTIERQESSKVPAAVSVWWVATLFGPDAAGGQAEVDRARAELESVGWKRTFHEVEQVKDAITALTGSPSPA